MHVLPPEPALQGRATLPDNSVAVAVSPAGACLATLHHGRGTLLPLCERESRKSMW